jgi:beta-lactamase class A
MRSLKKIALVLLPVFAFFVSFSQTQVSIPKYLKQSPALDRSLENIIKELQLDSNFTVYEDGNERISFAVIDLTGKRPELGMVNGSNFIYPASVYKMYVGMEILKQVFEHKRSLYAEYIVKSPNDVDKSKEISYDPRPLLKDGDTVTINYLLDLMITRSDNSAANCLIDVANRKNINATIAENGWQGSEVTRKFLKRKFEDPGYDTIRGTETCALHAADFMYKVYTGRLINPWVSMQMKALLGRQLDTMKLSTGLPTDAMFYHKTGWWADYTHDVGIVDDGRIKYIIAAFIPVNEEKMKVKFRDLSEKVYGLISSLHKQ